MSFGKTCNSKIYEIYFGGKANWNTLCSDYLYGKLDIEIAPGCQVEFDNRGFYFPVSFPFGWKVRLSGN